MRVQQLQGHLHQAILKNWVRWGIISERNRLDLSLRQKDVAQRLGVDSASVTNWEKGHTSPTLHLIPRIIEFLGYVPFSAKAKRL